MTGEPSTVQERRATADLVRGKILDGLAQRDSTAGELFTVVEAARWLLGAASSIKKLDLQAKAELNDEILRRYGTRTSVHGYATADTDALADVLATSVSTLGRVRHVLRAAGLMTPGMRDAEPDLPRDIDKRDRILAELRAYAREQVALMNDSGEASGPHRLVIEARKAAERTGRAPRRARSGNRIDGATRAKLIGQMGRLERLADTVAGITGTATGLADELLPIETLIAIAPRGDVLALAAQLRKGRTALYRIIAALEISGASKPPTGFTANPTADPTGETMAQEGPTT